MKKIFTLVVAAMATTLAMAQMHSALKFVGESKMTVTPPTGDPIETTNPSDMVVFTMADMTSGSITLPSMSYMGMTIPSFTIEGVTFSMGENTHVTFPEQTFKQTLTVGEKEKEIDGSSLSGSYDMSKNLLTIATTFTYGDMPFSITYEIEAYYVKSVTNKITVSIGGTYNYTNESVTYNVRKYFDGEVEKVDVEVPSYTLTNTVMGNLSLGSYTVKGLEYDETRGGFYRDYKNDGLSFHFTAAGGSFNLDDDYAFNSEKDNNILVKYSGTDISSITNTFQMGSMPYQIVTTFGEDASSIVKITDGTDATNGNLLDGAAYNLNGQRVGPNAKGIVIINGKKYIRK